MRLEKAHHEDMLHFTSAPLLCGQIHNKKNKHSNMLHFLFKVQSRIFSLSYICIKPIKSFMIFPDLSCLMSHGIDYNTTRAQIQPGMMILYGAAEVGAI